MRAVPMSMREGSYAMGATRFQTAVRVVTPAALSGITAAYILGISRAVGETMILAVAAGMQPNLTWNPMEPAATITSFIVQVALGDLPHGSIGYQTIFAAGLTLMLMTLLFNVLGHLMTRQVTGRCTEADRRTTLTMHSTELQEIREPHRQAQALGPHLRARRAAFAEHRCADLHRAGLDMAVDGAPRLDLGFLHQLSVAAAGAGRHSLGLGRQHAGDDRDGGGGNSGGRGGAVYLEEYAPKNWFTAIIEINITNLAGVPSIVYGLLALGLFVYAFGFGQSILSAGLTLALLILPVVIVATREAIRSIPSVIREAAYAVGATKWQTTWDHVLPYSLPGIMTGVIIGMARAIGETAPIITIGALTFIAFLPPAPVYARVPVPLLRLAVGAVHGDADPDVQLDLAPGGRVPSECRRRRPGAAGHDAVDERARHLHPLSPAQEHQVVSR